MENKYKYLLGKRCYGFKYNDNNFTTFVNDMENYIGKIGIIAEINHHTFIIDFGIDYWNYPLKDVEQHLVKEDIITETINNLEEKL